MESITKITKVVVESPYNNSNQKQFEEHIEYLKRCIGDCIERGEAAFASHMMYTRPHLPGNNQISALTSYEGHVIDNDRSANNREKCIDFGFVWGETADHVVFYIDRGFSAGMKQAYQQYTRIGKSVLIRMLNPVKLIAISGKMASGKSTLMNSFLKREGSHALSIAEPLKLLCNEFCRMPLEEAKKDRKMLIEVGDVLRKYNKNAFIDVAIYKMAELIKSGVRMIVVDDCRFKNEFRILKKIGFEFIRLECNEETRKKRIAAKYGSACEEHYSKMNNASETDLDDVAAQEWDVILNSGDLNREELIEEATKYLNN